MPPSESNPVSALWPVPLTGLSFRNQIRLFPHPAKGSLRQCVAGLRLATVVGAQPIAVKFGAFWYGMGLVWETGLVVLMHYWSCEVSVGVRVVVPMGLR